MATLGIAQYEVVYRDGHADRVGLVALKNVSAGDTLELGATGANLLSVITRAAVVGVTSFVEIAASWTGTVVTMPSGLSADAAYLLVWGSGAG
jgi:hypothetical protein